MRQFKKLEKEFTPKEIAESYIFPDDSTKEEREQGLEQLLIYRKKRLDKQTPAEKRMLQLLQLKFLMEDYINSNEYDSKLNFGHFLQEYIDSLQKRNKDFADDISISQTELSHYLNNRRKPNEEVIIRLEIHSNKNIPALIWYKILQKEHEHGIITDKEIRRKEEMKVKNKLEFSI